VVVKLDPANTELRKVLAQSCLLAKKYSCARTKFRQILEQSPELSVRTRAHGRALDGLGQTLEAVAEFEAAAKTSPREPEVNFGLGYLNGSAPL